MNVEKNGKALPQNKLIINVLAVFNINEHVGLFIEQN